MLPGLWHPCQSAGPVLPQVWPEPEAACRPWPASVIATAVVCAYGSIGRYTRLVAT